MKTKFPMTKRAVIKRMRDFNRWRRGDDERDFQQTGICTTQVGIDIEWLCDYAEENPKTSK